MDDDISDAASIIVQSNGISQHHITEGDGKDVESEQIPLEGETMEKRVMDETDGVAPQKLVRLRLKPKAFGPTVIVICVPG